MAPCWFKIYSIDCLPNMLATFQNGERGAALLEEWRDQYYLSNFVILALGGGIVAWFNWLYVSISLLLDESALPPADKRGYAKLSIFRKNFMDALSLDSQFMLPFLMTMF